MVVEPTHLKNMLVKLDHFPGDRGKNKKMNCHHLVEKLILRPRTQMTSSLEKAVCFLEGWTFVQPPPSGCVTRHPEKVESPLALAICSRVLLCIFFKFSSCCCLEKNPISPSSSPLLLEAKLCLFLKTVYPYRPCQMARLELEDASLWEICSFWRQLPAWQATWFLE